MKGRRRRALGNGWRPGRHGQGGEARATLQPLRRAPWRAQQGRRAEDPNSPREPSPGPRRRPARPRRRGEAWRRASGLVEAQGRACGAHCENTWINGHVIHQVRMTGASVGQRAKGAALQLIWHTARPCRPQGARTPRAQGHLSSILPSKKDRRGLGSHRVRWRGGGGAVGRRGGRKELKVQSFVRGSQ